MTNRLSPLGRTAREIAASAAILLAIAGCSTSPDTFQVEDATTVASFDYDFAIPAGAGEAIDSGEPLEILPAEIEARVGESIRIVNNDDRGHVVGIWFVGAGETMSQTFVSPGELAGECSVHPSGQISVTVTA